MDMDQLPLPAFEHILSYLKTLDRYNALLALNYDSTILASRFTSKILLTFEYRFRHQMLSKLIGMRKKFIKELDLTGIFWLPRHVILTACSKLPNLEYLYLLGTSVLLQSNELSNSFKSLLKIKFIAVAVIEDSPVNRTCYCLLERTKDFQSDAIQFDRKLLLMPNMVLPIVGEDWLTLIKAGVAAETVHREIKLSYTEVTYSDFLVDEQKMKEFLYDLRDVKALIVKRSKLPLGSNSVNIEPIKYLVNLTFLHIDVESALGHMFLKPILQSCSRLKSLRIRCYTEMFSLAHLKYATEKLEDLSVHMTNGMFFNMGKFLFDIRTNPSIKLRRIHLNYGALTPDTQHSTASFAKFMQNNPQLIFVYICCKDLRKNIADMKDLFKRYKKEPHQFFVCQHMKDVQQTMISSQFIGIRTHCGDIPVQHLNMLDI